MEFLRNLPSIQQQRLQSHDNVDGNKDIIYNNPSNTTDVYTMHLNKYDNEGFCYYTDVTESE